MYAQQYVENDVFDKSPVELIRLLYSKAIEKLRQAVDHTRAGDIRERSSCLARVMVIIAELQSALDPEAGGVLAADLARLYDYVQRKLIEAASDGAAVHPIEEVHQLLGNLYEGWSECEPPDVDREQQRGPAQLESTRASESIAAPGEEFSAAELSAPASPSDYTAAPADYSGAEGHVWTL